jgi:hypothetical protein
MGNKPEKVVLIIGSECPAQKRLATELTSVNFKIDTVTEGNLAVARFERHEILAILIVDMDGHCTALGAIARIRELPHGSDLPVIIALNPKHKAKVKKLGESLSISDYVAPSVGISRLSVRLNALIQRFETACEDRDGKAGTGPERLSLKALRVVHSRVGQGNHFERLGISHDSGIVAVRNAYKSMVSQYSYDAAKEGGNEGRRLVRDIHSVLREAYNVLRDRDKRRKYERRLKTEALIESEPAEAPAPPVTEPPVVRPPIPAPPVVPSAPEIVSQPVVEEPVAPPPAPPPAPAPETVIDIPDFAAELEPEPEPEPEPIPEFTSAMEDAASALLDSDKLDDEDENPLEAIRKMVDDSPSLDSTAPPEIEAEDTPPADPDDEDEPSIDGALDDFWARGGHQMKETHDQLAAAAHLQAVIGDYDGACELLQQCVRLKPDEAEYRYNLELNLGRKYKKLGNMDRARRHFETADECAPSGKTAAKEELDQLGGGSAPTGKSKGGLSRFLFKNRKR